MGLDTELQYDEAFAKQVFRAFLREGIIIAMPAQLKKRKVLLDYMVEDFEKGRSYTEQEAISRSWIIMMTSAPFDGR